MTRPVILSWELGRACVSLRGLGGSDRVSAPNLGLNESNNTMAATITASMVNELRSKTGQGMMECKKALTETGGDVEKAIEYFRKKGVKTSITERSANEGRLHAESSPDRKTAAIVVVNCNTDFTAKSEPVTQILKTATAAL